MFTPCLCCKQRRFRCGISQDSAGGLVCWCVVGVKGGLNDKCIVLQFSARWRSLKFPPTNVLVATRRCMNTTGTHSLTHWSNTFYYAVYVLDASVNKHHVRPINSNISSGFDFKQLESMVLILCCPLSLSLSQARSSSVR